MNAAAHNPSKEMAATARLTTTARELRNEIRGGGTAVGGGAGGAAEGVSAARRAMSSSY
jgi:hypothetical protein